ncbi:hypothetical protein COHA_008748, partial [Chlorella ohadii]
MPRHSGLQQISWYVEGQHDSAASVPLLFHGAGHYDLLLRQPVADAPRSRLLPQATAAALAPPAWQQQHAQKLPEEVQLQPCRHPRRCWHQCDLRPANRLEKCESVAADMIPRKSGSRSGVFAWRALRRRRLLCTAVGGSVGNSGQQRRRQSRSEAEHEMAQLAAAEAANLLLACWQQKAGRVPLARVWQNG